MKLLQDLIGEMNSLEDQSVDVSLQHPVHEDQRFLIIKIIIAGNDNFVMFHADIADLFQMDRGDRVSQVRLQNRHQMCVLGDKASGLRIGYVVILLDASHNPVS